VAALRRDGTSASRARSRYTAAPIRSTLLGLGWDEVDIDAGELRVAWQLQRVGGELLRRETKTESSDAPLPLPEICTTALKERRERQDEWRAAAGAAWQGTDFVISTRYGLPVEPRTFHRDFKARCARAGVRPNSVHSTRRTCASLLVALDVHPWVAMQVLRHSQIAITMNVYSEVSSAETRTALRRLGEQLQGEQQGIRCCTSLLYSADSKIIPAASIALTWVELRGLEPLTPSLRTRCATSCATAPRWSNEVIRGEAGDSPRAGPAYPRSGPLSR
jgi:hypothetical protein